MANERSLPVNFGDENLLFFILDRSEKTQLFCLQSLIFGVISDRWAIVLRNLKKKVIFCRSQQKRPIVCKNLCCFVPKLSFFRFEVSCFIKDYCILWFFKSVSIDLGLEPSLLALQFSFMKGLMIPVFKSSVTSRKLTTVAFASIVHDSWFSWNTLQILFFMFSICLLVPSLTARPSSLLQISLDTVHYFQNR